MFSDGAVAAEEHAVPNDAASRGCDWPAALTLDVDPAWRSGYYEVVLEIDVGEKVRRSHAFFVVRPVGARIVLALATTRGMHTTTSAAPPIHRRHALLMSGDGEGLPSTQLLCKTVDWSSGVARGRRPDPPNADPRRLHPAQPPVRLRGIGGVADWICLRRVGDREGSSSAW